MRKLIKISYKEFYKVNEFVARTTPMRTHYTSRNPVERWIWQSKLVTTRNLLSNIRYSSVLDVGCGDGQLLTVIDPSSDYIGVDISPTQLGYFRRMLPQRQKERKGTIQLIKHDAVFLPFKPSFTDLVLACDVIEHVLEPQKLIHEIHRVLKPKGYALFSIPNEPLWQILRIIFWRWPPRSPDHLYSIQSCDVRRVLQKVVAESYLPFPFSPFHLIHLLLVQKT